MTDSYATLVIAAKFSRMELLKTAASILSTQRKRDFKLICHADITCYLTQFFSTSTLFMNVNKIIDQHDRLLGNPRHCNKVFKNLTHFNNSRFLIMCYKNTENAPNVDYNRIPRQNTHAHIISKLQGPNYYYDSVNINVAMKTTISNNRNGTAMVSKQICNAVITSSPINIFSMGTLFTKVVKIIDQHDRLSRYP